LPEAQKIIVSLADIRCNILNRGGAIGGRIFPCSKPVFIQNISWFKRGRMVWDNRKMILREIMIQANMD
jgi:hypothetical protein